MTRIINLFILTIILLVISYFIYWNWKIYHFEFHGLVKKITYDDKGYPDVVINNQHYGFSFGKEEIQLDDSLVKDSKSYWVYQYRNGEQINAFEW